jgi:glycosyltransferase involved in cell wall biosynthesis
MKIIHIIYDSIGNPWLGGGGATRTQEIYNRLSKDHKITIVCGNYPDAPKYIDGVIYKHIGLKKNYLISRWSFIAAACLYLPFAHGDVFIEDIGAPGPLLITSFKKKFAASVQFIPAKAYISKRGILGRITYGAYSVGLRLYKNIITVSDYAALHLKDFAPNSNYIIIPNGVEFKNLQTRKSFGYFAYLGRVDVEQKGLDILLNATNKVIAKNPAIRIKIAGGGEPSEIKKLNRLIKNLDLNEHVKYVGEVNNSTKERFLAECKCLISPSRNETFGITLIEAFSHAKPAIASNVGGMMELINNSKAGILFDDGSIEELAKAMLKINDSDKLAAKLGKAGYDFAKHYNWDNIAKDYEKILLCL